MQDFRTAEEWEQLHQYANQELGAEIARLREENKRLRAALREAQGWADLVVRRATAALKDEP